VQHWSRHLLAHLSRITGAELLIGARAVTNNQHFSHFASPFSGDRWLGAMLEWKATPLRPRLVRKCIWQKVVAHVPQSGFYPLQKQPTDVSTPCSSMCHSLSEAIRVVHEAIAAGDANGTLTQLVMQHSFGMWYLTVPQGSTCLTALWGPLNVLPLLGSR
jgi:hypothetical protein